MSLVGCRPPRRSARSRRAWQSRCSTRSRRATTGSTQRMVVENAWIAEALGDEPPYGGRWRSGWPRRLSRSFAAVTAPAAMASCAAPANEIEAENCLPGNPPSDWDISGDGDAEPAGLRDRHQRRSGQSVRFKVRTDASNYRLDIYRMGYYRATARAWSPSVSPRQRFLRASPTASSIRRPAWSTAATGRVRVLVRARRRRSRASTSPRWSARMRRRGASHVPFVVRDDDGGSQVLFQTSDTTWQAYNQYGGNSLYAGRHQRRSRLQGQLQPAVHDPRVRGRGLGVQRRVPDGPLDGAQRLRRQLLHRRRLRPPRRGAARAPTPSCRSATTSTGRASSAPTSRRRATRASTSPSSAATRSSGRRAGRTTTARSSPTRRPTPTPRSTRTRHVDGHLARSSGFNPKAADRERADGNDLHGQLRHDSTSACPPPTADAPVAQHLRREPGRGADRDARAGHARLRVGRGRRSTASALRASSGIVDHDGSGLADPPRRGLRPTATGAPRTT